MSEAGFNPSPDPEKVLVVLEKMRANGERGLPDLAAYTQTSQELLAAQVSFTEHLTLSQALDLTERIEALKTKRAELGARFVWHITEFDDLQEVLVQLTGGTPLPFSIKSHDQAVKFASRFLSREQLQRISPAIPGLNQN